MDNVFSKYDFIIVYIDDILVHSLSEVDHLKHLEVFKSKCQLLGIVLSDKKIEFFKTSIEFLGIILEEVKYRCDNI